MKIAIAVILIAGAYAIGLLASPNLAAQVVLASLAALTIVSVIE